MGKVLHRLLTDLGEKHPSIGDTRSIGLFGMLELVRDRKTKEPLVPFNSSSPDMDKIRKFILDHGVFLYTHWHNILILPPLIITEKQLDEGFSVLDQALEIADTAVKA